MNALGRRSCATTFDAQGRLELRNFTHWWPLVVPVAVLAVVSFAQPASPLVALIMPGILALVMAAALLVLLVIASVRHAERARVLIIASGLVLCSIYVVFSVWFGGPFRVRLAASQDALHAAAMRAVRGEAVATPARIGSLWVQSVEVDGGVVRLRTRSDGSEQEGLAFFPGPIDEARDDGFNYLPLNWYLGQWFVYSKSSVGGI